jgi:hypothetical protein
MISRHDEHRHAAFGDAAQRLERLIGNAFRHIWPIEDVATVHHDVDLAIECRTERRLVISEEVVATTPTTYARTQRQVETKVRIGEEQDAKLVSHLAIVPLSVFVR